MTGGRLERVLTAVFGVEEINGAHRCPTYLYRWTLFQPRWPKRVWRGFGIYLHKFVGDDWSRDLHDHPKRFVSIGLHGGYIEQTFRDGAQFCPCDMFHEHVRERVYQAPWVRTFPADHTHRLRLRADRKPCWTLVIVLSHVREWGFWHRGDFIQWRDYVKGWASDIADRMKACP